MRQSSSAIACKNYQIQAYGPDARACCWGRCAGGVQLHKPGLMVLGIRWNNTGCRDVSLVTSASGVCLGPQDGGQTLETMEKVFLVSWRGRPARATRSAQQGALPLLPHCTQDTPAQVRPCSNGGNGPEEP